MDLVKSRRSCEHVDLLKFWAIALFSLKLVGVRKVTINLRGLGKCMGFAKNCAEPKFFIKTIKHPKKDTGICSLSAVQLFKCTIQMS